MDINSVIINGRLTRDVEVSHAGEAIYAKFGIATNGLKKDDVSFFDVLVWGKVAEICQKFLTKGSQVSIQGRLKQDRWEKDGHKNSRVAIVASQVQFISGKKDGQTTESANFEPTNADETIPF